MTNAIEHVSNAGVAPRGETRFTVVLLSDVESGGFTVLVPTLPGCITCGETIDEAMKNANEAIALYIEGEDIDLFLARERGLQVIVTQVSVD